MVSGQSVVKKYPRISSNGNSLIFSITPFGDELFMGSIVNLNSNDLWALKNDTLYQPFGTFKGRGVTRHPNAILGAMCVINDTLYLSLDPDSSGYNLYKCDKNKDLQLVFKSTLPLPDGCYPANLTELNGKLYFFANTQPPIDRELFEYNPSDGICKQVSFFTHRKSFENLLNLTPYNNKLYFSGRSSDLDLKNGIWCYEPATGTTTLLDSTVQTSMLTVLNDKLYYCGANAYAADRGIHLYVLDKNNVIQKLTHENMTDSFRTIYNINYSPTLSLKIINNTIYFAGGAASTEAIYSYNTTTNILDTVPGSVRNKGTLPAYFVNEDIFVYHNNLYFTTRDGRSILLNRYNGTSTKALYNIMPNTTYWMPWLVNRYTHFKDEVFFVAMDTTNGSHEALFSFSDDILSVKSVSPNVTHTAYPNPTHGNTLLEVSLQEAQSFAITLTDVYGRAVHTIAKIQYNAGKHNINIPMQALPTGIYYYRIANEKVLASGQVVKE